MLSRSGFNAYVGWVKLLSLSGLKVLLFKSNVTSRKLTIFKFKAISIVSPSNLNALIMFLLILEVLGPFLPGMKMIPFSW